MLLTLDEAVELIENNLSRTRNYPRVDSQLTAFAEALVNAAEKHGVSGARIVERCSRISEYCPTNADLFTVAGDIAREDAVSHGQYDSMASASNNARNVNEWRQQYGAPKPVNINWDAFLNRAKQAQDAERTMWRRIREKLSLPAGQWPDWFQLAQVARQLGYTEHAERWEASGDGQRVEALYRRAQARAERRKDLA